MAKRRHLGLVIGTALGVLVLLAAMACTPAEAELIQGILQNVDSISGEVTVELQDGETVTINLKDVTVQELRQGVGTASLGAGDPVTLERDENDEVKILKAHVTEVEGIITSIDPDAKTLTINDGDPLQVTAETKIEVNDDEATFDALSISQEAEVKFDAENRSVLKVEVEEEAVEGKEEKDSVKVKGILTAVDSSAKTVTILAKNGIEDVYFFQTDTKLKLSDERVGIFADLEPLIDAEVEAKFDRATNNLLKAEDEADEDERKVKGTLTAVDAGANSVTIRARSGTEGTYFFRPFTKLELGDAEGAFQDLEPLVGAQAEAKINPTTNEIFKLEVDLDREDEEAKTKDEGNVEDGQKENGVENGDGEKDEEDEEKSGD